MSARIRALAALSDWLLVSVVGLLVAIGLVAVWSFATPGSNLFARQVVWALLGFVAFWGFSLIDYRIYRNHGLFLVALYLGVLLLLAALLAFAPETRGVQAWFRFGKTGLQPVELAKLVLALVLAKYFSRRHVEIARLRHLVISGLYVAVAAVLVLAQPDFGSAVILAAIWLAVVVFSGIRFRHLAAFFLITGALAAVSWFWLFAPYQQSRITGFLDPYRDPRGAGYNTIQAMIAAGSGELTGKGIGYGSQSHLNFLPEAETDFVFAAFAEETGFIGALILLTLFGVLFWRIFVIGVRAGDNFSKLYVIAFAASLAVAAFIHIGMNLGVLPVTGIGLPFVSYGGSALITSLAGLGIVHSIRIRARPEIG